MNLIEKKAKTILIKKKRIDSRFISGYAMNLYRGCSLNCAYCVGRAENYFLRGGFGVDVEVKSNSAEILTKELDPSRKRKQMNKGFILIGGGICDVYEPAEIKYRLMRTALQLILKYNHPVHILTKSNNVLRDIDLISEINAESKAVVSFGFSAIDENISKLFEPGAPPPSERLEAMRKLRQAGIGTGMILMPVIPFVSDNPRQIKNAYDAARSAGADYLIFGSMTLKFGAQSEYFFNTLSKFNESLLTEYNMIYNGGSRGLPSAEYTDYLNQVFLEISKGFNIPKRIPPHIFKPVIDENNYVAVILDQLDYLVKLNYGKSNYGFAARSISELETPISGIRANLKTVPGVGGGVRKIIREILDTGTSRYYQKLL